MLTARKKWFAREWVASNNATNAAKAAGYSERTAYSIGSALLKDLDIKKEIARLEAARIKRLEITADRVLLEITRMAVVDVSDLLDERGFFKAPRDLPEDIRRAITGVSISHPKATALEIDLGITPKPIFKYTFEKKSAVEMLGKHFKMFTDKLAVEGNIAALLKDMKDADLTSGIEELRSSRS